MRYPPGHMAAEVESIGQEGIDYNVVTKGDKTLIIPIRQSDKEPYHPDPQIRAFQMVQEGKIGGAGRGQGRKRKPRAAEKVAEEVRKHADKIASALIEGLEADSHTTRLKAAEMAIKIERDETLLQLKEEEADVDNMGKEELVAELIRLASDPSATAQLETIDLPESAIEEVEVVNTSDTDSDANGAEARDPAPPVQARNHLRAFGGNGSRPAPRGRAWDASSREARSNGRASD